MTKRKSESIYLRITRLFVDALKEHTPPWIKPWNSSRTYSALPVNAKHERRYTGINVPILWAAALSKGYQRDRWLTFKQTSSLGGHIRRGEKGTTIIRYLNVKVLRKNENSKPENGEPEHDEYKIARGFPVFNVDQCIGLPEYVIDGQQTNFGRKHKWEAKMSADHFIESCGARIRFSGNSACYWPSADLICLPPKSSFHSTAGYYSTVMHELTHWTGHKSRLNRPGIVDRVGAGNAVEATEELIAEIGSAFLCAEYQIKGELRHEAYVNDWIKLLQNDPKSIFTTSARAWKAYNYLLQNQSANQIANGTKANNLFTESLPDSEYMLGNTGVILPQNQVKVS